MFRTSVAVMLLAYATAANSETYSRPACIRKTASQTETVSQYVTLTGADLSPEITISARGNADIETDSTTPLNLELGVDNRVVRQAASTSIDAHHQSAFVSDSFTAELDREYKISASFKFLGDTAKHGVTIQVGIGNGCASGGRP